MKLVLGGTHRPSLTFVVAACNFLVIRGNSSSKVGPIVNASPLFIPRPESTKLPGVTGEYRIQLDTVVKEYDGRTCWTQARGAAIPRPGQTPELLLTMQRLLLTGSDIYLPVNEIFSEDLGQSWSAPRERADALGRRPDPGSGEVAIGDLCPKWHAASGKVLAIGQTFRYRDERHPVLDAPKQIAYSSFDPVNRIWEPWATLAAPEGALSYQTGAGCAQRIDRPDGTILLPVYFKERGEKFSQVKVIRGRFDGRKLSWEAEGNVLSLNSERGLQEPSLTRFQGKYYLTIRHEHSAYVSASADGLNFGPLREWTRDAGGPLGSYNTQAHWVTRPDKLYLAYTRRGANNDHVFRHRAPLFMAEVDPENARVKMATERVLIPERGARYGNFGVCDVNADETWVVETEWMQRPPEEPIIPIENQWGAAGRVYASRILWETPNAAWDQH